MEIFLLPFLPLEQRILHFQRPVQPILKALTKERDSLYLNPKVEEDKPYATASCQSFEFEFDGLDSDGLVLSGRRGDELDYALG